ncbi:carbohydrate ABC transporter permease [Deefgea salmonis]|uniref:Sugar ABC transporter permease n=1 Tax=Deefgea salmonis TaxID=2875502 RepID=A0ABS8BIW0_9NEIS|nr:sugar ABC transporter permease [Deefgea salmonis]MCB5195655.1 sugar ABC transporter permease [Deefgea salmonis]
MKNSNLLAYFFLAPALIFMGVFVFWPVGFNTYLAFHTYEIAGGATEWNNFENFKYIWEEPLFHSAVKNSLLFLIVVPVIQLASLLIAKLVNNKLVGMTFFRAVYYIPVITAISIAGVVWSFVFNYTGMLNAILSSVGHFLHLMPETKMVEIDWLGDPKYAMYSIMVFTFWKGIGYYMVLYLAGLQAIPAEVEEAAILDGATVWDRFWKITVPMVKPTILLCTMLSTIGALKVFQEVVVLTGGKADTYTALFYVYDQAFKQYNFGVSAAAGLVVTFFCMLLAMAQFRFFGEKQ